MAHGRVSLLDIDKLWLQGLEQGRVMGLRVASSSMAPTLHVGDRILVEKYPPGIHPCVGEIVLFHVPNGWFVHRVIDGHGRAGSAVDRVRQKGDADYRAVSVPVSAVAGRVIAVERRDGSRVDMHSKKMRFVNGSLGRFFFCVDRLQRLGARDTGDRSTAPGARIFVSGISRRLGRLAVRLATLVSRGATRD